MVAEESVAAEEEALDELAVEVVEELLGEGRGGANAGCADSAYMENDMSSPKNIMSVSDDDRMQGIMYGSDEHSEEKSERSMVNCKKLLRRQWKI